MKTNIKVIGNALELENEHIIRTVDTILHFEDINHSVRGDVCVEIVRHYIQTLESDNCTDGCPICDSGSYAQKVLENK